MMVEKPLGGASISYTTKNVIAPHLLSSFALGRPPNRLESIFHQIPLLHEPSPPIPTQNTLQPPEMSLTNATAEAAAKEAKTASFALASLPASARNAALDAIHAALSASRDDILAANARDLELAKKAAADGALSEALVSRLDLGKKGKWEDMLKGILDVRDLEDPVGKIQLRTKLDDDFILERVSCPIGVILIIFEARPEVIANIASLAVKSGNAAILKGTLCAHTKEEPFFTFLAHATNAGGKESTESFVAISKVISSALAETEVPNGAIQLVTTRDAIAQLLAQDRYIDLAIPRGSNELVRYIKGSTKIPVLGHADGLCAMYLAASADPEKAATADAALGTSFPGVAAALAARGVSLRCDPASKAALASLAGADVVDATDADFDTEFLGLTLAVKTVSGVAQAIEHINTHGSHHTDSILTADAAEAERFMNQVDSAGVYWNASTRVADGMRYGFGTEVGISTNKIHARGPVGLEGLTIYKYKIRGDYQATAAYGDGEGKRPWKHEKLSID
ncbi:gamma-glutamyl phosphate reductase [Metarhizium acridum CQMa 102]|uniref:glutamate-5-semialdehyde dehydrogenase n=1 Tax=Metarhizium acridum (strain CQMa 102) TaxID=655827 RepID=E9E1W7_METAQ|nr:gamma-glutamyl phosphate reductase [Metarhizium acridum CQMa 102]EFY90064.1 gamma-glutamyl phosphate reductase [Metarhizium acridum CQMa 102]